MARKVDFNFGANKPKKPKGGKKAAKPKKPRKAGTKSNAWRAYVGSSAPIPD